MSKNQVTPTPTRYFSTKVSLSLSLSLSLYTHTRSLCPIVHRVNEVKDSKHRDVNGTAVRTLTSSLLTRIARGRNIEFIVRRPQLTSARGVHPHCLSQRPTYT